MDTIVKAIYARRAVIRSDLPRIIRFALAQVRRLQRQLKKWKKNGTKADVGTWVQHRCRNADLALQDIGRSGDAGRIAVHLDELKAATAGLDRATASDLPPLIAGCIDQFDAALEEIYNDIARGQPSARASPTLARQTGGWLLTFEGQTTSLPDRSGFRMLAELLAHPGEDVDCLALTPREAAERPELSDIERKLDEAKRALDDAEELGKVEEAARLREEVTAIECEMRRTKRTDPTRERARRAVGKNLRGVLRIIEEVAPELHRHLGKTLVGTHSRRPSYRPPPDSPRWLVQIGP